jgi:Zn-dependent protease with chaperone function
MASGAGIFYDGQTSARHQVAVEAAPDALRIRGEDGKLLAEWHYDGLEHVASADDVFRVGLAGNPVLARLEVRNPALAAKIDDYALQIDRTGGISRRARKRVIAWSVAATVSLVLAALYGVPALVERLAPLVPWSLEHRLGLAVEAQVRSMLANEDNPRPFECGISESGRSAGRAALDKLIAQLEGAAGLPIPLKTLVVRRGEANAIALPGGHIYVFAGLVAKARTPDELAGVIAHEIGHVAHRDGTRSILQAAGLSFLFGMLLGDFTGGGVVVVAAQSSIQSAYSRHVESAADQFGVLLMSKIEGDARALGTILGRIGGTIEPGTAIFSDHPPTEHRIESIDQAAERFQTDRKPLLEPAEWAALRRICE